MLISGKGQREELDEEEGEQLSRKLREFVTQALQKEKSRL